MNTFTIKSIDTFTEPYRWLQQSKNWLHAFGAYVVHKHQTRILMEHDDRLLKDIGVTRFELEQQVLQGFRHFRDEYFL